MDDIQIFVGKDIQVSKKETVYHVEKKSNSCSMSYFYEDPEDMKTTDKGGLNTVHNRPWPTFIKKYYVDGTLYVEKKGGRSAFSDISIYKPIQMKNYIDKYFIDPYIKNGKKNPFMFYENEPISRKKFDLNPQQKFCGQFMAYNTDFPGLLDYHGIGAGKTIDALAMGEANKSKYRVGETFKDIPDRKVMVKNNNPVNCTVTYVVPKNLINEYVDTIIGSVKNGELKSASSMCVIYCEDDAQKGPDGIDYETYRQYYQGSKINGQYENLYMQKLTALEEEHEKIDEEIKLLSTHLEEPKYSDKEKETFYIKINKLKESLVEIDRNIKIYSNNIVRDINDIYFIVTHETFISRLRQKASTSDKEFTASDFVLGTNTKFVPSGKTTASFRGTPIHPDCLHSNKTLFIIDEIQKSTSEEEKSKAVRYLTLYNTFFIYARSFIDASLTTRKVLLTATPVYNTPFQMVAMLNLLGIRLMFPRRTKVFNDFFIDKEQKVAKNKLLLSYMMSGYVSYLKGGNPEGYPYRKNVVVLHPMGSTQYSQYKDNLKKDIDLIKKDNLNKYIEESVYNDYENISKNIYKNSSNISMCAFPDSVEGHRKERYNFDELKIVIKDGKFGMFSSKLKDLGDYLKNAEGPIFVYSSYIERGLYPLILYMEHLGMEFIGHNENYKKQASVLSKETKKPKQRYAIWSEVLYKNYIKWGFINENQYIFREKIKALFNDPLNKDGSVCKIIFGNVPEGVSFLRVREIHLLEPWWNESRNEQIIGRGIRYLSHADLPVENQHITVYYHCSVLPTYPEKDESLVSLLGRTRKCAYCKTKANKKEAPKFIEEASVKQASKPANTKQAPKQAIRETTYAQYISDLLVDEEPEESQESQEPVVQEPEEEIPKKLSPSELKKGCTCEQLKAETDSSNEFLTKISIDQKIYIISRNKNKINKEFEQILKETAVDYDLNKYGNVARLEEFVYPEIHEKLLYNRTTNKYYIYKNNTIYNTQLEVSDTEWPPVRYTIGEPEDLKIKKTITNNKGSLMIIIDCIEEIESFNNNPEYNNMNFYELKEYATKYKGEDRHVWDEIEKYNKVNDLITILIKHNRHIKPDDILKNYKKYIREDDLKEILG